VNFLAHCVLARPGDGFLAGGVLGDFVKGRIPEHLPAELQAGIALHRRIDSYSNRLAELKTSIPRFGPALRRVAPVLLDIVADHCLALEWDRYGREPLAAFAARVYSAIRAFDAHVPARGRSFVEHMMRTDLLARYTEMEVVDGAMAHVLRRLRLTGLGAHLEGLVDAERPAFVADFHRYFPRLEAFAAAERQRLSARPS
jgi:acyl carrier protein phosphodiesterase